MNDPILHKYKVKITYDMESYATPTDLVNGLKKTFSTRDIEVEINE